MVVTVASFVALSLSRRSARSTWSASPSSPRSCHGSSSARHAKVKRAFGLNGYVGILYLLVLVASLWVDRGGRLSGRRANASAERKRRRP